MSTVEQALARTLRDLRREKNFSQLQVGEILDKPQATISLWENASRKISPTDLSNISSVYCTTPAAIYESINTNENIIDKIIYARARKLESKINQKYNGK